MADGYSSEKGGMTGSIKNKYGGDCPKFPDKSTGLKGPSVDTRAKREGTAPTPKTLGGRKTGM